MGKPICLNFITIGVLALLISSCSSNPKEASFKGTLLLAEVKKDGIIMAADSRGCIFNSKGQPIAYSDSIPKIFTLKKFTIAIAGASLYGKKSIYELITDFNKIPLSNNGFENTLTEFVKYVQKLYPASLYPQLDGATYLLGGYDNNKFWLKGYQIGFGFTEMVSTGRTLHSEYFVEPYLKKYAKPVMTIPDLAILYEKIMYEYAKGEKREYEIGGPISIVTIGVNNKQTWIKNNLSAKQYATQKDYINALKSEKIKVYPLIKDGDKQAKKAIIEWYDANNK